MSKIANLPNTVCPICFGVYDTEINRPYVLDCGHGLCSVCAYKINGFDNDLKCMYCAIYYPYNKDQISKSIEEISASTKNIVLYDFYTDKYLSDPIKLDKICHLHNKTPTIFDVIKKRLICIDCFKHNKGKVVIGKWIENQKLVDLKIREIEQYKNFCNSKRVSKEQEEKKDHEDIKLMISEIENIAESNMGNLTYHFNQIRLYLDKSEEFLKNRITSNKEQLKSDLNNAINIRHSFRSFVLSQAESIDNVLNTKDDDVNALLAKNTLTIAETVELEDSIEKILSKKRVQNIFYEFYQGWYEMFGILKNRTLFDTYDPRVKRRFELIKPSEKKTILSKMETRESRDAHKTKITDSDSGSLDDCSDMF